MRELPRARRPDVAPTPGEILLQVGIRRDVDEVLSGYAVTFEEIVSGSREAPLPKARAAVWSLLVEKYEWSAARIGRVFGFHHTAVLAAMRKRNDGR